MSSQSSSMNKSSVPPRQFSPLVIYHDNTYQQKQTYQTLNKYNENQMNGHRSRVNDMLHRNASWWAHQEKITQTTIPEQPVSPLYKRGFVRTAITDGDNHYIYMLTSSSTTSTSSNSSSDSNDSIATTPTAASAMMSMSTLMISAHTSAQTSSPTITPMEPKTDMPPPPLYQTRQSFTMDRTQQQQLYRHHRHSTAGIYSHHSISSHHPAEKTLNPTPSSSTSSSVSSTLSSPTHMSSSLASSALPAAPLPAFSSSPRSSVSSISNNAYTSPPLYDHTQYLENETIDCYNTPENVLAAEHPLPSSLTSFDRKTGHKKRRRGNLPKHVTEYLKCWLLQHKKHPYPTERQKLELAQRTGLAVNQISNWFINARRRILQPMLETEQLFAKQQHYYMNTHQSSLAQQHLHQSQQSYSHPPSSTSNLGYPTNSSTSALATMEDKKRRQLDIYAYHGFTETTHDTQRWSVRRTKLPNIEIPEKDQHIFATDH